MGRSRSKAIAWAASAGLHVVAAIPLLLDAAEAPPLVVPVTVTEIAPITAGPAEPTAAAAPTDPAVPVATDSVPPEVVAATPPEAVASEAPPDPIEAEAPQEVVTARPPDPVQAVAAAEPVTALPPESEPAPERAIDPAPDLPPPPPPQPPPPRQRAKPQPQRPRPSETAMAAAVPSPPAATAAAAIAPAPMAAPVVAARPSADYLSTILSALERHKRYPAGARRRRAEGVAMLRFRLRKDGAVTTWRIERSTGDPELDAAVAAMIQDASPLPALPAGVASEGLELVLPVRFNLR